MYSCYNVSLFSKVNTPPPADMRGKKVGALLFREYDAMIIADNGGYAVHNTQKEAYKDFYADFLILVHMVELGHIDGLAVDQYTYLLVFLKLFSFSRPR